MQGAINELLKEKREAAIVKMDGKEAAVLGDVMEENRCFSMKFSTLCLALYVVNG